MATLTQTSQGDLTSFIAGKIFERVKASLEDNKDRKGSPEVEKAIKKFEDPEGDVNSIPVVDEKLRRQVAKLFGANLEIRLVQLEGKVEKTNAAVKTIGGSIQDTQQLIINQNQILEDKFDTLLDIIGVQVEEEKKNKDKLEGEKIGADIFGQKKQYGSSPLVNMMRAAAMSGSGLFGFLARRAAAKVGSRIVRGAARRFIPRRIRARGRMLRGLPKRAQKKVTTAVLRRIVGRETSEQVMKRVAAKSAGKVAVKKVPILGLAAASIFAIERAMKGDYDGAGLELMSGLAGTLPTVGTATSMGIDAYIIKRDVEREIRGQSYASGTGRTKKGPATLHGTELILGKKDIQDIALGFNNAVGLIGSVLTSVSLDVASAAGAESEVRSLITDDGLAGFDRSLKYSSDLGIVRTNNLDVKAIDSIASLNLPFIKRDEEVANDVKNKDIRKWYKPWTWFRRGGNNTGTSIEHKLNSLIDKSGEPGVDFTPTGINNRALFDGEVVKIGYDYDREKQSGYGNFVVVRSEDPNNGELFDALYAHIPKNAIYVNVGDQLKVGDRIGRMGTEHDAKEDVGSIDGTHMSVDFYKADGTCSVPYAHWKSNIVPLVDTKFGAVRLKKQSVNPDLQSTTIEMLTRYESFEPNAYDDGTGVWTVGYGATMIRDEDSGVMRPVREGDTVTREQAKLMKRRDYWIHYDRAEKDLNSVGLSLQDLPVRVAAPLVSAAFNYGSLYGAHKGTTTPVEINGKIVRFTKSLPEMVRDAYKSGDYTAIADLFEYNLGPLDDGGLNLNRRRSEANIIKSGTDINNHYELQNLDLPMSFFPNKNRNLLNAKLDSDSREVEELFENIANAGQPIIVLNTQIIAKGSDTVNITKNDRKTDWINQYQMASLG